MGRDRRLRQTQLAVYQSGTDAEVERMLLLGEMLLRLLQPLQDLSPHGIGQRLVDGVDVQGVSPDDVRL